MNSNISAWAGMESLDRRRVGSLGQIVKRLDDFKGLRQARRSKSRLRAK